MGFKATHRIKPGCGYWCTDRHPIGGEFHRAGKDGIAVESVGIPVRVNMMGYLQGFVTEEGSKVWTDERGFEIIEESEDANE